VNTFEYSIPQILISLLLVVTANTAAWAAARVFRTRWDSPLDGGKTLHDGTRLLGSHKTWRGMVAAAVACGVAALFLRLGFRMGAAFGVLALLGDAASSFVKRRVRIRPGAEILGLDQLAEAILPLVVLREPLRLGLADILIVAAAFLLLDVAATKVRHI
jgi:CDP-2,3-bis-(O-geranylgeranyl)-sn-glycerol synthase